MSDTTIIVISILVFFLVIFGVTAWLVFYYFPKKTLSVANDLANTVKNTLGISPQVTINQKIISRRTNEIMELAMIEQDFDVEHETSHTWMRSEKKVTLRGSYRAKIGFNLQKGFNIEVHRGGFLRPGQITLELPRAEVLSVEPIEVQKTKTSGLINWVTNKDIESATDQLNRMALDKASKLDMLEDAEKRIEQRLKDALLPKLTGNQFNHEIRFLELKSKALVKTAEEKDKRFLNSPEG